MRCTEAEAGHCAAGSWARSCICESTGSTWVAARSRPCVAARHWGHTMVPTALLRQQQPPAPPSLLLATSQSSFQLQQQHSIGVHLGSIHYCRWRHGMPEASSCFQKASHPVPACSVLLCWHKAGLSSLPGHGGLAAWAARYCHWQHHVARRAVRPHVALEEEGAVGGGGPGEVAYVAGGQQLLAKAQAAGCSSSRCMIQWSSEGSVVVLWWLW